MTWIEDGCPEVTGAIEKGGNRLYAFLSRFGGDFQARRAAEEICATRRSQLSAESRARV